jgi:transglutaminase/protease-like cytokinesis protein 3
MIAATKKITLLLLVLISTKLIAQNRHEDFRVVDEYVKSLGTLDTLNMGTISYIVTKKFPDNKDKARAIFDWIASNIAFDYKSAKKNDNEKNIAEDVLKFRKATSAGYAALFQDMCSVAKIRCLTVDGYLRNNVEQFTDKPETFNHTWNVVQLGTSPESWFYVDPTLGSGYTDDKLTMFTKEFNDAYFFADKTIFNYQHLPDNHAWLLGPGTKSKNDFFSMPLVKNAAYEFGVGGFSPNTGYIKTNTSKTVQFSCRLSGNTNIDIVALAIGDEKRKKTKTVDYTISDGVLRFGYKFAEEITYPVTVLINNKPVLGYFVEATE